MQTDRGISRGAKRFRTVGVDRWTVAVALAGCTASPTFADIRIDDTEVFPESISAGTDGTIYVGSVKGNVYRALPGADIATPWIRHSPDNGILTILGVLADNAHDTLWLCSVPNFFGPERSQGVSSLMAFDLGTGEQKGVYPFPAPASVCNDVTIAADGTAFASDTSNGRIFTLAPGADSLALYGQDPLLNGIDGLAFSADGTLYVNNVRSNQILRVETDGAGRMTGLKVLALSHELGGPDGMRLIEGNRFIQAEGTIGRLAVVTIDGDSARLDVIDDTLLSTPGATTFGNTAYVLESEIRYLTDPSLRGQQPESFMIFTRQLPPAD